MPFTEQQLTSALATISVKKKSVFFSSTKKTIYLYPFTDSAGGQLERTETLVYSAMIVQTHAAMKTQMGNWPDFSSAITFFYICSSVTSVILKRL